jgi:hypothetical protein
MNAVFNRRKEVIVNQALHSAVAVTMDHAARATIA